VDSGEWRVDYKSIPFFEKRFFFRKKNNYLFIFENKNKNRDMGRE